MMGTSKLRVRTSLPSLIAALLNAQQAALSPRSPRPPGRPPPATAPATAPASARRAGTIGGLNFYNASLSTVIDILAQNLKINYILDPKVNGKVTMNTYGEIKPVDVRQLLDTILRINGAVMVQVGDLYRIVPAADAVHVCRSAPRSASATILPSGEEQVVLNLIFLKYVVGHRHEDVDRSLPRRGQHAGRLRSRPTC